MYSGSLYNPTVPTTKFKCKHLLWLWIGHSHSSAPSRLNPKPWLLGFWSHCFSAASLRILFNLSTLLVGVWENCLEWSNHIATTTVWGQLILTPLGQILPSSFHLIPNSVLEEVQKNLQRCPDLIWSIPHSAKIQVDSFQKLCAKSAERLVPFFWLYVCVSVCPCACGKNPEDKHIS